MMLWWKDFIMMVILVQLVLLSAADLVLFFVLLLVPKVYVSCSLGLRSCLGLAQKLKPNLLTLVTLNTLHGLLWVGWRRWPMTVTEAVLSNSTEAESCNRCEKKGTQSCAFRCENNNGYLLLICLKTWVSCSGEELHQMIHQHMESFIKYTCTSITNSSKEEKWPFINKLGSSWIVA
jgi:hypothetical protein